MNRGDNSMTDQEGTPKEWPMLENALAVVESEWGDSSAARAEYDYLRRVEQAARAAHYLMDVDAKPGDEAYICGGCGSEWPCPVGAALDTEPRQEGTARHE